MPPKIGARKLLVASVGVATINYVAAACGGMTDAPTSANLPAPIDAGTMDAMIPPTSANLPAPPFDAGEDAAEDASDDAPDGD